MRLLARARKTGSTRIEVFPAPDASPRIRVMFPGDIFLPGVEKLLDTEGFLKGDLPSGLEELRAALAEVPQEVRFSCHLDPLLEAARRRQRRVTEKALFLTEVKSGRATLEVAKHPLLPYQREGMLHLAFGERTLLADEMGLGKTVQGIAACELLRRLRGIRRVLVVLPASLKAEWEEQIAHFCDHTVNVVTGSRPERLRRYAQEAFFTLVNYEQVLSDRHDINRLVAPDVVVLDEAQRIKNWQTQTARAIKELKSPYAFVLTGTPLENRIDEIYSIVQYLDPHLLGPLFRFNRDYYQLDERGRPIGYRNLDQLHQRLEPVMLRRRKSEMEGQLPGRTVDTFFVAMTPEQKLRYGDYEVRVGRLVQQSKRRPLTREEFEKLQQWLACMRMICDTPYILDPACRDAPKLEELARVLEDLLAEPGRKVILFSEWERMLELVGQMAREMGVESAWHTGSVPQVRRRTEIQRFKKDAACRLFLSTDAGSVGLNLQVASAVINLDLPWNPARLEQRIARAWRKYQTRTVTVIHLVCEDSIEHRMLHVLESKQTLADGILDGQGDLKNMAMPSGRAALLERLERMMQPATPTVPAQPPPDPGLTFTQAATSRLGDALLLVERICGEDGRITALAVLERTPTSSQKQQLSELAQTAGLTAVEVIDRTTWETLQRLATAGLLTLTLPPGPPLHRSLRLDGDDQLRQERLQRKRLGQPWLEQAERKLRMASLLADSGFDLESITPLMEVSTHALRILALATELELEPESLATLTLNALLERENLYPHLPSGCLATLGSPASEESLPTLQASVEALYASAQNALEALGR